MAQRFTARSGNRALIEEITRGNHKVFDVNWRFPPSDADMNEIRKIINTRGFASVADARCVENEVERETIIKRFLQAGDN